MAASQTAYDEIPYQSNPFRQTRPECLAAVAKLFGLDAPAAGSCRVLCPLSANVVIPFDKKPEKKLEVIYEMPIVGDWYVVHIDTMIKLDNEGNKLLELGALIAPVKGAERVDHATWNVLFEKEELSRSWVTFSQSKMLPVKDAVKALRTLADNLERRCA